MKKLLAITLTVIVMISCSQDVEDRLYNSDINKILGINEIKFREAFEKDSEISFLTGKSYKHGQDHLRIQSVYLENDSLNDFIVDNVNEKVVCITSFERENNSLGFLVYYIDNQKLYAKTSFPDKDEVVYQVNGIVLQDILFVQKKTVPSSNISLLFAKLDNTYNEFIWNNSGNDIALLRYKANYIETVSQRHYNFLSDDDTNTGVCGASHVCSRGEGSYCDAWKATCRDVCSYVSVITFSPESEIIEETLTENNLHQFKNALNQTKLGKSYVKGYYELSSYFGSTLDLDIITEIIGISNDVNNVVDRYLNGTNEILFENDFYLDIKRILNKSIANSQSPVYNDFINIVLLEMKKYENLTVNEVKSKLDNK